jgi:hypothetical protein
MNAPRFRTVSDGLHAREGRLARVGRPGLIQNDSSLSQGFLPTSVVS